MGDYWNEDIVRSAVANQKLNIEGEHPAPFPQQIVLLPIIQTSKEFELVLDPFIGSGTTGRVCEKLNRSFVGYDLKGYFQFTIPLTDERCNYYAMIEYVTIRKLKG